MAYKPDWRPISVIESERKAAVAKVKARHQAEREVRLCRRDRELEDAAASLGLPHAERE